MSEPRAADSPAELSPANTRFVLDGPTRVDRQSQELARALGEFMLPRTWSAAPRYEDLVAREIERVLSMHGEDAFAGLAGGGRPAPLMKAMYEGSEQIKLAPSVEAELRLSSGRRGFRRICNDDDGSAREYWVRLVPTRRGIVELRLTWYGSALPLLPLQATTGGAEGMPHSGAAVPYERLGDEDRGRVDRWATEIAGVRCAREVLERVLLEFGRTGENPVRMSMRELRLLLRADRDSDRGVRRVLGCLRALQELRYDVHNVSGRHVRTFGPCIAGVRHVAQGRGAHAEGDVYIEVSTAFVGCLSVFADAPPETSPRRRYNWMKTLSRSEKAEIRGNFARLPSALLPSYAVAMKLTRVEFDLLTWIDEQLTRDRDASRSAGRLSETRSDALREYDAAFCSALPNGRHFFAALGHFSRSAESGFSLLGTRSSSSGIAGGLGLELPPRRSRRAVAAFCARLLALLQRVVVGVEGGLLAGRTADGRWLTPDQARGLQPEDLAYRVSWFIFLPTDVLAARRTAIEVYAAARRRDGGPDVRLRVTAEVRRTGGEVGDRHVAVSVASSGLTLGERLRAARLERRLTLSTVAGELGVSYTTIANWERGIYEDGDGVLVGKRIPPSREPLVEQWLAQHESDPSLGASAAGR